MTTANEGRDREAIDASPDTARQGRIPADTFSNRLLLARKLAGMTIDQAAMAAGLTSSSWSNWEDGRRPRDIVDVCGRIAEALDVSFDWLLLGGPLAGPRGMPTKRTGGLNLSYVPSPVRPTDNRPKGRPGMAPRTDRMIGSEQRRPVRIHYPTAA